MNKLFLGGRRMASELLWARIFDFAIRDSEWFRRQTLNPGRWALGFPALYILFRTLEESRPQRILEFGLGESTRMTGQYAAHFAGVELTVVEQNEEWKATFCSRRPELRDRVKIVPIVSQGGRHDYQGLIPQIAGRRYDLIIIDGPWGSPRDSRREILDIVEAGLLAERFTIIFDDTDRRGERDTLRKLSALLHSRGIAAVCGSYRGEKDCHIVCSPDLAFLRSL